MDKENDKYLTLPETDRALVSSRSRSSISSCSSLSSQIPKNNKILIIKDEEEKKDTTEISEEIEEEFTIAMEEKIEQNKQAFTLKYTKVGIFKLYSSLSSKFEIIFIILGTLGSLGAGVAHPLFAILYGQAFTSYAIEYRNKDISKLEDSIEQVVNYFLLVGVGMFVSYFLMYTSWFIVGSRQTIKMKQLYFQKLLQQEQAFFDFNNAYEFSTKVQGQMRLIENGMGEKFGILIMMTSQFVSGLIIAFSISWILTLITLTVAPLIMLCGWIMSNSINNSVNKIRKEYEKAGGVAEEVLTNIKTVASNGNFKFEKKRFDVLIKQCMQVGINSAFKEGLALAGLHFFSLISFSFAIIVGSHFIANKQWNSNAGRNFMGGDVITVIIATMKAVSSIRAFAINYKHITEAVMASSDFFALIERQPFFDLSESKLKPNKENLIGEIIFKDICFTYPTDPTKKILKSLNMTFEPGKKIAIVGESGSGKSTIINLIERFYDADKGSIFMDNINIKHIDIEYLRSLIAYVQQEPVLLDKSIKENIIFGREGLLKEDNVNIDELVRKACDDACVTEFVNKLKGELEFKVGIKGSYLSGGQKQRIAIARAILTNPKIIILDEATSALDNISEKWVQMALDKITKKNVTTIIVAHRLSTIKNADKIYVLNTGKVVEVGTHQSLLEQKGYYSRLIKSQMDDLYKKNVINQEDNTEQHQINGDLRKLLIENQIFNKKRASLISIRIESIFNNRRISTIRLQRNSISNIKRIAVGAYEEHGLIPIINQLIKGDQIIDNENFNQNSNNRRNSRNSIIRQSFTPAQALIVQDHDEKVIEELESYIELETPRKIERMKVFRYLNENKLDILFAILGSAVNGGFFPIYGYAIASALNALNSADNSVILNEGLSVGLMFIVIALSGSIAALIEKYYFTKISEVVTCNLRAAVFSQYLKQHIGFFDMSGHSPGALMTKLSTDTTLLNSVVLTVLGVFLQTIVCFLLGICLGFYYDWRLTFICLAFFPFIILTMYLFQSLMNGYNSGENLLTVKAGSILSECIINTKTIYSYNFQQKAINLYTDLINKSIQGLSKNSLVTGFLISLGQFTMFASFGTLFYIGGKYFINGTLTYDNFTKCISSVLYSATGIGMALQFLRDFSKVQKAFNSIFSILELKSEIDTDDEVNSVLKSAEDILGKIEFRNVTFAYPNRPNLNVLKNISFIIEPGENIAFVGLSGCGKSTIISLLERFYDVNQGEILIDNVNIKEYNLLSLRRNIGLVLQEPCIFKNRSVKDNIKYGNEHANDEEIYQAAFAANCLKIFTNDDNSNVINESNVSIGEKQRIALARAFVKNPKILLLDEATSALDNNMEVEVQKAINNLRNKKPFTIVNVAHRLSTIKNCHVIYYIENGDILEKGTHEKLLSMKGKYYNLYKYSSK